MAMQRNIAIDPEAWKKLKSEAANRNKNVRDFAGEILMDYLKGGLVSADILNTVSRTYAEEILKPEYGYGLDGVLRTREADLYGVINGIDYDEWDPGNDQMIAAQYRPENLSGKAKCKKEVIAEFFPKSNTTHVERIPVLGMVGRLVEHKGMDALMRALPEACSRRRLFSRTSSTRSAPRRSVRRTRMGRGR